MTNSSEAELADLSVDRSQPGRDARDLAQKLANRTHELAQSEARFRDIIERNADALVVVGGDGVVRFANRTATALFGKRREELVGASFGFPMVVDDTTEVDILANGSGRVAEMRVVESEW